MRWAPRKTDKPTSSADLQASASQVKSAINALEGERDEITEALPKIALDPSHTAEAEARLAEIEALLPPKRRGLAAIKAAIPEAERREALAAYQLRKDELERGTIKLQRDLERRYTAAASGLAAIMQEMEENAREWDQIDSVGRGLGVEVPGGWNAEYRLRRELHSISNLGFDSLWRAAVVESWNGRPLFRGPAHRYA